jgi:hypothetical protein
MDAERNLFAGIENRIQRNTYNSGFIFSLRQNVFTTHAVNHYNNERPHNNLGRMSPFKFNQIWKKQSKKNRRIEIIFDTEIV